MFVLRAGKMVESQEKNRQRKATKKNWMSVRVAGFGNALRIDFEDVFVRALDMYHIMHRIYSHQSAQALLEEKGYELSISKTPGLSKHLLSHVCLRLHLLSCSLLS